MKKQINNNNLVAAPITSLEKCTGCQACKQICPHNAIDMIEDDEGFIVPQRNSNCTNCRACVKICPIINNVKTGELLNESEVYLLRHKDNNIVKKSSSGGAFTAIVQEYDTGNCIIFGAEYENNFRVAHNFVQNGENIDRFRKSKYVQSDVKDTYVETKKFLLSGKKVIYSGTPCQIAGLRNYLGKDYINLLCVDLICHGVPSQKVFNKYIDFLEKKTNSKVKSISFRERIKEKDKWNSRCVSIMLSNNQSIVQDLSENEYLKGYHSKLFYRKSCESCKFASIKRNSDITIADCWGIENVYKDIDANEGYSMVVVNTKKGAQLFDKIREKQEVKKLSLDFAILHNYNFNRPTKFHKNRKMFYENVDSICFDKLINKCLKKELIKAKIKRSVPRFLKNILNKFLGRK